MVCLILWLLLVVVAPIKGDQVGWELRKLRDRSSSGVVTLDDVTFDKYTRGDSRPYSLVIFFNAKMKESPNLRMGDLFTNYKMAAHHVKMAAEESEHAAAANKLFFVEMEFEDSKQTFGRLGIQQIPWIINLEGSMTSGPSGVFDIKDSNRMRPEDFDAQFFEPRHFMAFIAAQTGHDFGTVHIPALLERPEVVGTLLVSLVVLAFTGWRVYTSPWIGNPWIWTAACGGVFMFAASGGLFNIIRSVPFTTIDQSGRAIWYTPGQGQLGAEGFVVGCMYVAFAACCILLTKSPQWFGHLAGGQGTWYRPLCYTLIFFAVVLVKRVVDFYTWKTGYRLRLYLVDWMLGIKA